MTSAQLRRSREPREGSSHDRRRILDTSQHSVTVPSPRELRLGTLDAIVTDVVAHLGVPKSAVRKWLF